MHAHTAVALFLMALSTSANCAQAAERGAAPGEEVEIDKIKDKYWSSDETTEVGVVQNRLYSKAKKFELGLDAGMMNSDPFLSVTSLGGSLGYSLTEYLGLQLYGWQASTKPSSALLTLQRDLNTTANTNEPRSYWGGEARASLLYGKLSFIGTAILYFDAHLSAGLGSIRTESGTSFTQTAGIGQQIHLNQLMSLNLDFRYLHYSERIVGKTVNDAGRFLGERSNTSTTVTLGISFFVSPF
jgi:outer membrane beta-barrel protein